MAISAIGSPIERPTTRVDQPNNGPTPVTPVVKKDIQTKSGRETFNDYKNNATVVGGILTALSAVGLYAGYKAKGNTFPAKALQVLGDGLGSASALAAPYAIIKNEIDNFNLCKNGGQVKEDNLSAEDKKKKKVLGIFDDLREGFYRCSSLGFTPFIFEPFINPEKFGKSIFHKVANFVNIPNLIFTGIAWGGGNAQALLAWGLKKLEQGKAIKADKSGNQADYAKCEKNIDELQGLYDSSKRLATIGSIANPTLQGIRQCADTLATIFGQMSLSDFFERPTLALSRVVSLFAGPVETYAKLVDSVVRVVKEKENLKPALPGILHPLIDATANWFEPRAGEKGHIVHKIRNNAEKLFHTISPLSMFALFTPLLDEPHLNEEAQSRGGAVALFDKVIGRYSKTLTVLFTGLYVTLGRLPQSIFQMAYFGTKWKSGKDKNLSEADLNRLVKDRIANNSVVSGVSNFAKSIIENYLVEDFYTAEHDHGYLTYEQIQANYSFDQAKEHFKDGLIKGGTVNEEEVIKHCLDYVRKDAAQGEHTLTANEERIIEGIIKNKIKYTLEGTKQVRKPHKFLGADFLATYIVKLFDLKSRINAIDYRSDHHNMTTAYDNDEKRISFEYELLPVVAKCTGGLRNTVNRIFGVAA